MDQIYTRLPDRRKPPFEVWAVLVLAIFSGLMLLLANFSLFDVKDWLGAAKAIFIAVSATLVAYGINRLAIEKGVPLAAANITVAGVVSITSIIIVGVGLFLATYTGLTRDAVDTLRLDQHGQALSEHVEEMIAHTNTNTRAVPVLQTIEADGAERARCEAASSCFSGRGSGGAGPVSRGLSSVATRTSTVTAEVTRAVDQQTAIRTRLSDLLSDYNAALANGAGRAALQQIDAHIARALTDLQAASPVALIAAYAGELQAGATIPNRPEVSARLTALMQDYSRSLTSALSATDPADLPQRPDFPGAVGVNDTLGYAVHFAPIFLLTFVVELIFPIALWLYAFFTLRWKLFQIEPTHQRAPDPGGFTDIVSRRPMDSTEPPKPARAPRARSRAS